MKIGILKIGANITQNKSVRSAANFDIFSLADLLKHNNDIHIITKKTRNTVIRDPYSFIELNNITDMNDAGLECLMVFNGAINFFGGNESPEAIKHWKLINEFKGRIYYVMTDIRYPLYQILDFVKGKEWGKKYEDDQATYFTCRQDIRYLYQGRAKTILRSILNKKTSKRCVPIQDKNIHSFPIEWAIMANEPKLQSMPWESRTIDLIYGGANRDSHRKNKLKEYFGDNPLDVMTFGPIKLGIDVPSSGTVSHDQFMRTMSKSKATIIVGDRTYHNNFFTLRMYESIFAGCVTFIDRNFDKDKLFYANDDSLKNFLYVSNQEELVAKIRSLDDNSYREIANRQLQCIRGQHGTIEEYTEQLEDILRS